jgi:hypothetical protein
MIISNMTSLLAASFAADDLLNVVDVSALTSGSKKATISALRTAITPVFSSVYYVDAAFTGAVDTTFGKYSTLTAALTAAIAAGGNIEIVLSQGTYDLSTSGLNISNVNNIKIRGTGKTRYNGSSLTGGSIITSAATSKTIIIQNNVNGLVLENIGVINTSTGDTIGASGFTGITIKNVTVKDCITVLPAGSGHGILFEEAGGTIQEILVQNCQCYNGNHGIIFKAKNSLVDNCYVENALIYSYAAISDNLISATRLSASKNVTFRKCIARRTSSSATSRGYQIYGVDFYSETNSNSVVAPENIVFDNCLTFGEASGDMQQGFTIARSSAFGFPKLATGQSQVAPVNVKMIGCVAEKHAAQGFVVNYGTDTGAFFCTSKNNVGVGFDEGSATTPRAIGCFASGNSDDTYTGWSTGNI